METDIFCFLNVYKPKGITSFDVIYKLRKILNIKKIGHSGTLDPMADGVLQIGAGKASRLIEYLNSDKEYIAKIKFGYNSTTLDSEGEITNASKPDFTKEELIQKLKSFEGQITQTPPMYSAIKVKGRKLYEIARKNPEKEVEIPERQVTIKKIELLNFKMPFAVIKVACTKGTYIRTLAFDIAKALGTGGYLVELTRTRAGNFILENSIKIEDINIGVHGINPLEAIDLYEYKLNDDEYKLVKNGNPVICNLKEIGKGETIILSYGKKLVSVGVLSDNRIKIKKVFS